MTNQKYKTLSRLIIDRGVKKSVIAKRLGISPKTLCGKIRGDTGFIFDEAKIIRDEFFPDVPLEHLFEIDNDERIA